MAAAIRCCRNSRRRDSQMVLESDIQPRRRQEPQNRGENEKSEPHEVESEAKRMDNLPYEMTGLDLSALMPRSLMALSRTERSTLPSTKSS